jgi:type I restriction enzyme, S subunit
MDAVGEFGGIRLNEEKELCEVGSGYTYFCDDDVVVAKITPCFENGKAALAKGLLNKVAFGTTELHVLRADSTQLVPQFLFYLTISDLFRKLGESEMYGAGGQKRVPESFIKDFRADLPSTIEQATIARFLDFKTAQIDALIAKQKTLLDTLAEKRTALISHTVTKGLDPLAQLKQATAEWLGFIPRSWEETRVKFKAELILGLTYSPDDVVSHGGTLVLRSSNVQSGKISLNDCVYVSCDIPTKIVTKFDDILICSRNGSRSLIGKCALLTENVSEQAFGAFMTVLRSPHARFLYYVLNSTLFKFQSGRFLTSTINQLTTQTLGDFPIALPPPNTQAEIVKFLDAATAAIEAQLHKAQTVVDRLIEYRSALITNAVTGKIDLRGINLSQNTDPKIS